MELLVEVEGVAEEAVAGEGDLCGGRLTRNLQKKNNYAGGNDNRDGGLMERSRKINKTQSTVSLMEGYQWRSILSKRIRSVLEISYDRMKCVAKK